MKYVPSAKKVTNSFRHLRMENRPRRKSAACPRQCEFRKSNCRKCRGYTSFMQLGLRVLRSSVFACSSSVPDLVIILSPLYVSPNVRSVSAYAFSHSSYAHTFATRQYVQFDEGWRNVSTKLPDPNLLLFLPFSPSSFPIGFRMSRTLPRFVYFLYIRRGFRSATFTLPCQAVVEVFCNPGKDVPREKIDFTPGRAFCHVLKRSAFEDGR